MMSLGEPDAKKTRVGPAPRSSGPATSAASSGSAPMESILGDLPARVGEGEHERPLMEAIVLGMQDLSMEIKELKTVVLRTL